VRRAVAVILCVTVGGCAASSSYVPQVTARGEIVLRYDNAFEAWSAGKRVARGLRWRGLTDFVRCVPPARDEARGAEAAGARAIGFSAVGGALGVLALGGLYGLADTNHEWQWLGAGLGSAAAGLLFASLGRMSRNIANGRAVDAINLYNDAVGSLGATCSDLRYPPPAGPVPPPLQGPPPQAPSQPPTGPQPWPPPPQPMPPQPMPPPPMPPPPSPPPPPDAPPQG
jgi:hypothetical protein